MYPLHPYAIRQAARTGRCFVALASAVLVLVLLTDEDDSSGALRLARMAAFCPGITALAVGFVVARGRGRGEERALAALGVPPTQGAMGAMVAGWLLCVGGLLLLQSPWVDLRSLFPSAASPLDWVRGADGSWNAPSESVTVYPDGSLKLESARAASSRPANRLHQVALATFAPIAIVIPVWAAVRLGVPRRAASVALTAAGMLVGLHAVASGALAGEWLLLAGAPLWLSLLGKRPH